MTELHVSKPHPTNETLGPLYITGIGGITQECGVWRGGSVVSSTPQGHLPPPLPVPLSRQRVNVSSEACGSGLPYRPELTTLSAHSPVQSPI